MEYEVTLEELSRKKTEKEEVGASFLDLDTRSEEATIVRTQNKLCTFITYSGLNKSMC